MEGRLVLLPFLVNDAFWYPCNVTISLKRQASSIHIFLRFIGEKGTSVNVRKNSAILKRAMTERHTGWSRRDWNSNPKHHWRSSAVEGAGQSSNDKWKGSKIKDKWKEASFEMDALKEKTRCKESAKRESEFFKMVELAAIDERQEDKERNIIKKTLKQLRKDDEGAEEARTLLCDMHQNVDEADAKVTETRSRPHREINEYMHSWDQELGRPHHIMDKMWQMMQSNDTETMNLDKDFEEMVRNAKQTGWNGPRQHGSGQKKRNKIRNQSCSALSPADGTHYELCGRMVLP